MLEHLTLKKSSHLIEYIEQSDGINVAFVFDGFDEYSEATGSFIENVIKCEENGKMFHDSVVVITSQQPALSLRSSIIKRFEILGFSGQSREDYILLSLGGSHEEKQKLEKHLKEFPTINNLCYIPLNLAIVIHLFNQNHLPKTLVELNKSFMINIIYSYLERNKLLPHGIVTVVKLEDFPKQLHIPEFVEKLSQLAFKGLLDNHSTFTPDEIKKICPEVHSMHGAIQFSPDEIEKVCPEVDRNHGAIRGFGLLQPVDHLPERGAGTTTSVNFYHCTMQEYLAAQYISELSDKEQLSLMKRTFWDSNFNYMWVMYVGIVGVKSKAFASFIDTDSDSCTSSLITPAPRLKDICNDKRKCLHLFQCYMEAKSSAEMCKTISSIFTDGDISFNDTTLLPHHISSLTFFMSSLSTQQWKILNLCNCNLGDIGMTILFEHVSKNDQNMSEMEYVDLTGNCSSPWGVYIAIIRQCRVNSLTLCGDEGMEEYVTDSLRNNETLQSLTLCKIGRIGVESVENIIDNTTLVELNLSWGSNAKGTKIFNRQLKLTTNGIKRVVNINILSIIENKFHLFDTIELSSNDINDDAVYLLAYGLDKCITIKRLDLSHNDIGVIGMNKLSECVKNTTSLEYVNLSENKSSPWGVYCAIIGYSQVDSLTLCGDEGMEKYVKEITDSLKSNITLQSLTLYKIKRTGVKLIKCILTNNPTVMKKLYLSWELCDATGTAMFNQQLHAYNRVINVNILCNVHHKSSSGTVNLSKKNINDDAVYLITFGLYDNKTIKELDLSHNNISMRGMNWLSKCFRCTKSLEYVDLSGNESSPWGAYCAIIEHCNVNSLTLCVDEGIKEYVINKVITYRLQRNTTLQSLTLYMVGGIRSVQLIKDVFDNNTKESDMQEIPIIHRKLTKEEFISTELGSNSHEGLVDINMYISYDGDRECSPGAINMSDKGIDDDAVCLIALGLHFNTIVKKLDLSYNKITDEGAVFISECLKYNNTLQELNLSKNYITSRGMDILSENIRCTMSLEDIDLSRNDSSPWEMYCAIIRHCCVNSLTLRENIITFGLYNNKTVQRVNSNIDDNNNIDEGADFISNCLKQNNMLKELNLSGNHISSRGMINLSEYFVNSVPLEYADLSGNWYAYPSGNKESIPWGVYCAIIKHCSVNSLTLCGDNGMNFFVDDITRNLHNNEALQSLTLYKIGKIGLQSIIDVLNSNTPLKELNVSWNSKGTKIIHRKFKLNNTRLSSNDHEGLVDINILYDGDHECSSEIIDMSNKGINDDAVYLITFGLHYNTTVQRLDLSCNNITDNGTIAIAECLKANNALQELNLSKVSITDKGLKNIMEAIHINITLQKLDLSQNRISDHGMIMDYLKDNKTLKELNLSDTHISKEGLKLISETLHSSEYSKTVSFTLHEDQNIFSGSQTLSSLDETVAAMDNRVASQQTIHHTTSVSKQAKNSKNRKGVYGKNTDEEESSKTSDLPCELPTKEQSTATTRKRSIECGQDTTQSVKRKRGPTKKMAAPTEYKREAKIVTAQRSRKRKAVHKTSKGALKRTSTH